MRLHGCVVENFSDRFEGQPLKGIALSFGPHTVHGETIITRAGLEGGAIYALSGVLREAIANTGKATLHVALRPDLAMQDLMAQLSRPRGRQSLSNFLHKAAHLSPAAIGLLQEAAIASGVPLSSLSSASLAGLISDVPVELNGIASIARAISTAGGISLDELDADFMIRRLPGVFAAGEMLDWEAPTGGYLRAHRLALQSKWWARRKSAFAHPCNSKTEYRRRVPKGMACRGVHSAAGRWRSDRAHPEQFVAAL